MGVLVTISIARINEALQAEDVEGLITLGAPRDEYSSEAQQITAALAELSDSQLTEENIVAIIALVWTRSFGLTDQDIGKRMHAFQQVAHRIL